MHWTEIVAIVIIVLAVVPVLIAIWFIIRDSLSGTHTEMVQRTVPGFGEFTVMPEVGLWSGSWQHSELGEVSLGFDSKGETVPEGQVQLAKEVLQRLPELVPRAVAYYQSQPDAMPLTAEQFDGLSLHAEEANSFSLSFELNDEHDTFVSVQFEDFKPTEFDCGD